MKHPSVVWKMNERRNSDPYWQATDGDTGRFVSNKQADPLHDD